MTTSDPQSETSESGANPIGGAPELHGLIRCVRCGYNLQGVSVRSICSECGLPVSATILAIVDPRAAELAPIEHPRLTTLGVLAWAHGLFVSLLFTYALQIFGLFQIFGIDYPAFRGVGLFAIGLCAMGSIALVRPHGGMPLRHCVAAAMGVLGFIVSMRIAWSASDPFVVISFMELRDLSVESSSFYAFLAAFHATIAASLMLVRVNARMLAARSVLMRSGLVNRQTLAATSCVLAIAALSQIMVFADTRSNHDWLFGTIGSALSITAGTLLIVGGFGLVADSWRLAPVLLEPPVQLSSLLRRADEK